MKKIALTIFVLLSTAAIFFYFSQPLDGDTEGEITIRVYNETETLVIEDTISFDGETSLFEILNENYNIGCANQSYQIDYDCSFQSLNSHIILMIEDVETDWYDNYLQIFINDQASNYGVDLIMIEDDTIYEFRYVDLGGDGS